ncbi:MAG: YMGG-like glycine zipper-containing protein [Rhodospirillaceae bacterium]
MTKRLVAASLILMALSACGYDRGERALSGAGIGAAGGAALGAITGGDPLTGAVIGGAGGAAVGAFTDPDDVNLDRRRRD